MSYGRIAALVIFCVSAALAIPSCGSKGKSGDSSAFKHLPSDTDFVLGINGERARAKVKRYAHYLPGKLGDLVKSLRSCGIDLVRTTESATIGSSSKTMRGVAVVRGFSKADFKQCAEIAKELDVVQTDSNTAISMNGVTMNAAWIDETTFVGGPMFKAEEVAPLAAGKGGATANSTLTSLLGDIDQKAAVWFVFAPEDTSQLPGGDMIGEMVAAFGTVQMTEGVVLTLGVKMKKAKDAKGLASLSKTVMPQFKNDAGGLAKFLDRIKISHAGKLVRIELELTDTELKEIESIAKNDPKLQELRSMLGGE